MIDALLRIVFDQAEQLALVLLELAAGDEFVHESYIGSQFKGRVEALASVGEFPAIVPSVEGWARVYGHNLITVDPDDDPFWAGFTVT